MPESRKPPEGRKKRTLAHIGQKGIHWYEDITILARLEKVAQAMVEGKTRRQIGQLTQVSESTAKRDIKRVRALWLAATTRSVDERRAESRAHVGATQAEAWTQYHSLKTDDKDDRRTVDGRAWLRLVLECEDRIVDLDGTRAPAVLETPDLRPPEVVRFDLTGLPDRVLRAIADAGDAGDPET